MMTRPMQTLRGRSLALSATLASVLILAGCQEDSRASKTSTDQAASIAGQRLDKAMGSFRTALGQDSGTEQRMRTPTLTWNAPLTREDGSSLYPGQISGYRIYYRLKHENTLKVIPVDSPQKNRFTLNTLPPGAYEFSITTVDDSGLESRRSTPVSINLTQMRQG
jgi:hypothetical protein